MPSLPPKIKILKLSHILLFHMKTRVYFRYFLNDCSNKILLPLSNYQYNHWNSNILFWYFTWQTRSLITFSYYIYNLFIRILVLPREVYCYLASDFCTKNTISTILLIQNVLISWCKHRGPSSTVWWICIRQSVTIVLHVRYAIVYSLRTTSLLGVCIAAWHLSSPNLIKVSSHFLFSTFSLLW